MATTRELILQAVHAALEAAGDAKPADLTVHRNRTIPLRRDSLPAQVVYRIQERVERGDGPRGYMARRTMLVRVECRVATAADGQTLDEAMDELTGWAVAAVMADPTLGGLAHNTQEVETRWLAEAGEEVYGAAAVDFAVEYVTQRSRA